MAQDIIADALNQIMNAKRIEKRVVEIKRMSKFLIKIFEMMKEEGQIDFEVNNSDEAKPTVVVKILKLNECRAVKPRYYAEAQDIDKYLRRFLPSRNFGSLVVSTNKGLMNQKEAKKNKIGGAIIAYFY